MLQPYRQTILIVLNASKIWLQIMQLHGNAYRKRYLLAGATAVTVPLLAMVLSYIVIAPNKQYIYNRQDVATVRNKHVKVGIVMGAGITKDGKPYKELRSRLDVAARALQAGEVQELILSGDNRFKNYDEPTAMRNYLISTHHVAGNVLQPDYAGRSTYETCDRAAHIFELRQTIIFSAGSHLPRAIYLCRQFGIEAYGVASPTEANNAGRREAQARVKALYNVYVHGENTIMGTPIRLP